MRKYRWLYKYLRRNNLCKYHKYTVLEIIMKCSMSSQLDHIGVTEDLKAFERRLTEYVSGLHPKAIRWRIIFAISTCSTIASAWIWMSDESTSNLTLIESLWNHQFFTINLVVLALLFLFGIHKRIREPQTIIKRCRLVLEDYNMSCDEKGRLILRPQTSIKDNYFSYAR
ncbi:nuclear envelope phosphatase-regulatory subunit 1-like [Xenia sp. Carnegie-2017]|uniref:nuclear envelope phosphatase-regulatory subunit 1-like n=1 Tax=Xenia sp. Carnegie-2017 TaxID=2897299 RepID=UPI001F0376DC|nr:nuclear envelope phosphatase-regulatory subunit 1-like [Xenia sp. Carnegie-2017]